MRRITIVWILALALLACSARVPHSATPAGCHDDTPDAGVCSPLRPIV